jgi:hypothetical protein
MEALHAPRVCLMRLGLQISRFANRERIYAPRTPFCAHRNCAMSRFDWKRGQVLCAFALASSGARRSPFPMLALQHAGELPHRRTGDELDRHAVCAQRERQPLSVGSGPGEEGQATVPAEREVEPRRVGARCAPATLAFDDRPPQGDPADDGADRLAQRVAAPDEARRRLDRGRGVESALTVGLRRSVRRWRGRAPPVASLLAEGDRLAPR